MGKKIYRVLNEYNNRHLIIIGCACFIAGAFFFKCKKENNDNNIPYQLNQLNQSQIKKDNDKDIFYDIYQPPLRDDNCSKNASRDMRDMGMPINVQTQQCSNAAYRQVGILTRQGLPPDSQNETILPLFGRPLIVRRDKWNFYSVNDKNNMIKLPVTIKGQSGTNEYGCDNVYDKDLVFVKGFNKPFIFTAYDEEYIRYIP